jgi:nucleoside-diphosphate-sugar epimerase
MHCFITGATGFIGSAVAQELIARGHEVVGLTSSPQRVTELMQAGIRPVVGDIQHPEAWAGEVGNAEAIVHTATLPTPNRPGSGYVRALVQAQERVTRQMLEAASSRCRAFIYTSGMTVYGAGAGPRSEDAPLRPYRVAEAYAAGERLVLSAAWRRGLPAMVLRPAGVYGTGGIFGRFWAGPIAAGKRAAFPGSGRQLFSFVSIEDCVQAYVRCVEQPLAGEAVNVADDEPVPLGTLIRALAEELGAPRPFGIPAPLFRLLGGPLLAEMLLNSNVVDNRKLVNVLGVPLRYPTYREGVPALARLVRETSRGPRHAARPAGSR